MIEYVTAKVRRFWREQPKLDSGEDEDYDFTRGPCLELAREIERRDRLPLPRGIYPAGYPPPSPSPRGTGGLHGR